MALERVEDAAELAAQRGRPEAASGPAHREPLGDEPRCEFPVVSGLQVPWPTRATALLTRTVALIPAGGSTRRV